MKKIIKTGGTILEFFNINLERRTKIFNILRLNIFIIKKFRKIYLRTKSEFYRASTFASYLYNKKMLKDKIKILKNNLDSESVKTIDLIIDRYKYLFSNNLISLERFNLEEKRRQSTINFVKIKKKYPGFKHYDVSTFKYHNGLVTLSDSVLRKMNKKDCIDAGGYIGDSAIVFSKNYDFKRIFSFEPLKNNYSLLVDNIKKYKMENVFPYNKGLGEKQGIVKIKDSDDGSFITNKGENLERIGITTIDKFALSNKLNIGLIKMDIEGYEMKAIRGAVEIIKRNKPILLISIYHLGSDFFEIKPFLEKMNLGYNFKIIKLNPFNLTTETTLICW